MSGPRVDVAIVGGTVVDADRMGPATVLVADGKICGIVTSDARDLVRRAETVIDASDHLVMPGGVDPHTHPGLEFGGYATQDSYGSCSVAAVHGGTTTFIDFAIPMEGETPVSAASTRLERVGESLTDVALHGGVTGWDLDNTETYIRRLVDLGIRTVKMFTTYRGFVMLEPDEIRHVLELLVEIRGIAYVHAEADHIIAAEQERLVRRGMTHVRHHPESRPVLSEVAAVESVCRLAEFTGARVYFVHMSSPDAVRVIGDYRRRGVQVFAESCPHYLTLTDEAYRQEPGPGFVCCPPIRPKAVVDGLASLAVTGQIDAIGSDHCCFTLEQKRQGQEDFRGMPYGLPGIETRLPVIFSEFVAKRGMAPTRFVELVATSPARLAGLYPRKGTLAPGSDADIVVWDPTSEYTLSWASLHMPTDYSPYEGRQVRGRVRSVVIGGELVLSDGEIVRKREGRFVPFTNLWPGGW